ncbi:transposable element Tcb1 transposase [Trichonephila clavipes]|nr:transposable element Tcb1 transposase [Trichonephila clavipes]
MPASQFVASSRLNNVASPYLKNFMPWKIGSRVGRNQTTEMRICDHWMQEGTTDRRSRSHLSQCTTSLSACTIRHRLQQSGLSARPPLLGLPLTRNYRHLRRQWCDERRMWTAEWKEFVFTEESRICLQHHDGRIRVWRHFVKICRTATLCTAILVLHRVLWYGTVLDIPLALL